MENKIRPDIFRKPRRKTEKHHDEPIEEMMPKETELKDLKNAF